MSIRRGPVIGFLAVAVLAGGIAAWRHYRPSTPAAAAPPVVPADVSDPEVRAALEKARAAVVARPTSAAAWGELGMMFHAHVLYEPSDVCLAEAARLDPADPRWPYLIAIHLLTVDSRQAIPYLRTAAKVAKVEPYRSAARLRLAETLLDQSETAEAEQLFAEQLTVDPTSPRARVGLAAIAASRGEPRRAIDYLKGAAELPSARNKIAAALAAAYRQAGEAAAAEPYSHLAKVMGDSGQQAWPDPFMAECAKLETGYVSRLRAAEDLEAQDTAAALTEAVSIREELARTSADEHNRVALGVDLVKLRRLGQAQTVLREVLAKSPDRARARDYLGVAVSMEAEDRLKVGDRAGADRLFEEAVREFRLAATTAIEPGPVHLHAGMALKSLGRLPEAADEFRGAIQASPDGALAYLGLGEVLLALNEPAAAIPPLETAVRLAPADPRAKALLEKSKEKAKGKAK